MGTLKQSLQPLIELFKCAVAMYKVNVPKIQSVEAKWERQRQRPIQI